jgi:acetyl esterase/lipase
MTRETATGADAAPDVDRSALDFPIIDLEFHAAKLPAPDAPDAADAADAMDPTRSPLVLVLPGGGYSHHADHEGTTIGQWLAANGLNAAVFRYPLGPHRHPEPIVATRRVLAQLRRGIVGVGRADVAVGTPLFDTSRIGVIGFSAGGHLAATLSSAPTPSERDAHDLEDRPDLAILCYAVTSMIELPNHGSRENLLGPDSTVGQRAEASADLHVDPDNPPTFLWHTAADSAVPLTHALSYARGLALNDVPVDLHVYAEGRHGLGLATDEGPVEGWSDLAIAWLRHQGW